MIYASVCSGVEAASIAWIPLGWKAAWFSEIEKFPCAVLKKRFPNVPNLGDMTKITVLNQENGDQVFSNGNDSTVSVPGGVDLLVGGTPCQGFSVAGKQGGLNDPRSVLCLAYVRLLKEIKPQWFVWENVPGVFSTNGGEDFKAFLRAIDEIGYSLAWRVLDAQYVRVDGYPRAIPQRRRRVFVVGHLGEWQYPAQVLFEPEGMFGDTPPRRVKGKGITGDTEERAVNASGIDGYNGTITGDISATVDGHSKLPNGSNLIGRLWDESGVNPTLNQCNAGSGIIGASNQELFSQNANGLVMEVSPTLDASYPGHLNHQYTGKLVIDNAKFWNGEDVSTTLTEAFADDRMPDKGKLPCVITESGRGFYSESAVGQTLEAHEDQHRRNIICRATQQGNAETMTDCCPTITEAAGTSGNNQPIICAGFCQGASPAAGSIGYHEQVSPTIKAGESGTAQVPALLCVHGSQDPIVNSDHANAIGRNQGAENCICYENHAQDSRIKKLDSVCSQISAKAGTGGGNLPLVMRDEEPIGFIKNDAGGEQQGYWTGAFPTIRSQAIPAVAIAENVIGRQVENGGNGIGAKEEVAYTQNSTGVMGVSNQATVRRLLPVEYERLMGFPDGWTDIYEKTPDSPRYKACGNSMCVNVMRWIGMRIENVQRKLTR